MPKHTFPDTLGACSSIYQQQDVLHILSSFLQLKSYQTLTYNHESVVIVDPNYQFVQGKVYLFGGSDDRWVAVDETGADRQVLPSRSRGLRRWRA